MIDNLFVYGSLRSECHNLTPGCVCERADSLGRATVQVIIFRAETYSVFQHEPDGIVQGGFGACATPTRLSQPWTIMKARNSPDLQPLQQRKTELLPKPGFTFMAAMFGPTGEFIPVISFPRELFIAPARGRLSATRSREFWI